MSTQLKMQHETIMSHLPAFEALRASVKGEQRRLDVFAEEINSTLSFHADVYEKHIADPEGLARND